MYCLSTGNKDINWVINKIRSFDLAEIRLDLSGFGRNDIEKLIDTKTDLIFTFRNKPGVNNKERISILSEAVNKKAAYVDLDIDNDPLFLEEMINIIHPSKRTKLIISYHNYKRTPSNQELFEIIIKASKYNPDIIKLTCYSHGSRDNDRILQYNDSFKNVLAFNMGAKGSITRAVCLLAGAPFSYVCLEEEKTAPGQLTMGEMDLLLKDLKTAQKV